MMDKVFLCAVATLVAVNASPVAAQGGGITQSLEGASVKGISHVGITVSDIDATIAFYSKAVPYPVIKRFKLKGSVFAPRLLSRRYREVEIALIAMPTGIIQLMDFEPGKAAAPNPRPVIGPGYTHICFQSSARDPAVTRFMAAGLANISRFGKAHVRFGGERCGKQLDCAPPLTLRNSSTAPRLLPYETDQRPGSPESSRADRRSP